MLKRRLRKDNSCFGEFERASTKEHHRKRTVADFFFLIEDVLNEEKAV